MWPWLTDIAATYTFKVEASLHHEENAAQQFPHNNLLEEALALTQGLTN